MAGNVIGTLFRFTSFGESHGSHIGGVVDGCPSNMVLDMDRIADDLSRRRPKARFSTSRVEEDRLHFLSGLYEGKTLGTPIAFIIENASQHSADYEWLRDCYRPSHADYVYQMKYGVRDHRGGGRASARETASRVVAGSIAKQIIEGHGMTVEAYTSQIGDIVLANHYTTLDLSKRDDNELYCPDADVAGRMMNLLDEVQKDGDTVGGVVTCVVKGCPIGLGEPIFDRLQAALARAMMSIPSAKGFDYGDGFGMAAMRGSRCLDVLDADFSFRSNHSGGIQGGIANGEDIFFRVAFKPIASLGMEVPLTAVDGSMVTKKIGGRHDVCQVPRAVPVVEAMAAIVLADMLLLAR